MKFETTNDNVNAREVRAITFAIENYREEDCFPVSTQPGCNGDSTKTFQGYMTSAFKDKSPKAYVGASLLEAALKCDILEPVAETLVKIVSHSDGYIREAFKEGEKILTAYRGDNTNLRHAMTLAFSSYIPNPKNFAVLAHSLDGSSVVYSLSKNKKNPEAYEGLLRTLHEAAEMYKTSSPLSGIAQALSSDEVSTFYDKTMAHKAHKTFADNLRTIALITHSRKATVFAAKFATQYVNEPGAALIMELVAKDARKSPNPREYVINALKKYDSNTLIPRMRRQVHTFAAKLRPGSNVRAA